MPCPANFLGVMQSIRPLSPGNGFVTATFRWTLWNWPLLTRLYPPQEKHSEAETER